MIMQVYTNPRFFRGGTPATKIMFVIDNLDAFGVYLNNKTGRVEVQKYINGFNFKNIASVNYPITKGGIQSLIDNWNNFTEDEKDNIKRCAYYLYKAYNYYLNAKKNFSSYPSFDDRKFMGECRYEYYNVINSLYNGEEVKFDPNHAELFSNENNNQEIKEKETPSVENEISNSSTRQSIAMFKLINANNFMSMLAGNFYPIIKQNGDYCIIKDDNGTEYTVRNNRGKIVNVFTNQE